MFLGGSFYWFLMGIVAVFVGIGFKIFAEEKGWTLNWWKWTLIILWYGLFNLGFLTWGTLAGENEPEAGWKAGVFVLFLCAILGVGLWRLLAAKPKTE